MRKPLTELTIEDLLESRVWRYEAVTGDDDALVESTELNELNEDADETFIALTEFTLGDGTVWLGYCSPSDPSGLDYIQPVIITGGEHLRLWDGPSAEAIAQTLNRSVEQVFPIRFEARVPVDAQIVRGVVTRLDIGAV